MRKYNYKHNYIQVVLYALCNYIIYIYLDQRLLPTNEAISYTHNYREQAVIRLYYNIGMECNNTENTS